MKNIRYPAVAGVFYPADPVELREQVVSFLSRAERYDIRPKALVAPHAGYIYSGPVAAYAYVQLDSIADQVRRVVLLGPAHRMGFHGLAYCSQEVFSTPLGDIRTDTDALARIAHLPQVKRLDAPFEGEHSLEVHMPFLQLCLRNFKMVPLLVGDASLDSVAEVIEVLWGGDETLIVVSSDLSHYLDYDSACDMDSQTTRAIEQLEPNHIAYHNACGRNPLNGLLEVARRHGLKARTLDLRNSGDTAGPRNQVVGYGAYAFE